MRNKKATSPSVKKCSDLSTNIKRISPKRENTKAKIVMILIELDSDSDVFTNKKIRLITIAGFAM